MAARHQLLPDAALRSVLSRYPIAPLYRVDHPQRAAHASNRRGEGVEFRQFRPYQQGDDLRRVDWRLYGRSDRLYVREAEQESRLTIMLVIDTSGSMSMGDGHGQTRLAVACKLAAAIAWLASRRQHACGLMSIGGDTPLLLPAAVGAAQFERILRELEGLRATGNWGDRGATHNALQRLALRCQLFVFSDFFERSGEQTRTMRELAGMAHGLTSIQLLTDDELRFRYRGQIEVVDVESGATRRVDAERYRAQYLGRLASLLDETWREHTMLGARFVRATTATPLVEAMRAILDPSLPGAARVLADPETVA